MEEIKILSVEEVERDNKEAYGASLVQYRCGDVVSFLFTDIDVSKKDYDLNQIVAAVEEKLKRENGEKPLWSDLSEDLLDEILFNPFDMHFVEDDDKDWTQEKADAAYEEADNAGLSDVIREGEDGCYLTIYAGTMGEIDWTGHPYYGDPCLEKIIVSPERIAEIKSQDGIYEYVDSFGDTNYVKFELGMYQDNDNLYVGLIGYDPEFDAMAHYGNVTVNVFGLPYLHATLDTNNNGSQLIPFLIENGFGELTGQGVQKGFCTFPVFKFNEEKLKEVCPKEFNEYQKTHGKTENLDEKISEIQNENNKGKHADKSVVKEQER